MITLNKRTYQYTFFHQMNLQHMNYICVMKNIIQMKNIQVFIIFIFFVLFFFSLFFLLAFDET